MNRLKKNSVRKYKRSKKVKYITFLVNLIVFLWLPTAKSHAQDNVLVIHSYHSNLFWTKHIKEGIDQHFNQSKQDVTIFHEFLDSKRYPKLQHSQSFLKYIDQKYKDTPIDVLMVSDDPGLDLILKVKQQYFKQIPIVFLGINHITPKLLKTPEVTGVFENRDVSETIVEAYKQTTSDTLIVINDSTQTGQANQRKINQVKLAGSSFKNIEIINDLVPEEINTKLSQFSQDTPVFLIGQLRDNSKNGALINFESCIKILRSKINNPVYAVTIEVLNRGIVGGRFLEGKTHAQEAVKLTNKILQGVPVEDVKPILKAENSWFFDAKELKKRNIDIESLPEDSEIINLKVSFYEKHRRLVWITTIAFSTTLLIIILLIEIIRRSSITEKILRENKVRYKDLAQAGANIFWEINSQGNFSYISGNTEDLYNKKPQYFLGKSLSKIFLDNPNIDFAGDIYENTIKTRQSLENFIFSIKQQDQEVKIIQINGKPIYDHNHTFIGYRGIQREITQEHNLSQKIAYQASYDSLTGLINRREFNNHLKNLVQDIKQSNKSSVLCFLDLDRFKLVNDTAGHLVGDALLAELANLLQSCLRNQDILGRLAGDEFGLLLTDTSIEESEIICQNIIDQVENYKFSWNNRLFGIGISIGVLSINNTASNATELLSKADIACYKAKDLGRGRMYIADHQDRDFKQHCLQMEYIANVSQAIDQEQFYLVKQLIKSINTQDEDHEHYEILLRYKDEHGNIISPGLFIPAAEKYGVITIIDRWVVETLINNYQQYFPDQKTMVSINLSGISMSNKDFIEHVIDLISNSNIEPNYICFEITETAAVSQISQATKFMSTMKKLGVKFALDDFGSGFSSFGYLKTLPVDYLKIDGSLIKNIVTEPSDHAIVDSVNCIAQMMNMKTIAEFVENDQILQILAEIGVDYAQGYGIGKPINTTQQPTTINSQL